MHRQQPRDGCGRVLATPCVVRGRCAAIGGPHLLLRLDELPGGPEHPWQLEVRPIDRVVPRLTFWRRAFQVSP